MLFGAAPTITVFGIKVNGMEDGASVSVGPTSTWGLASHTKALNWNQHQGDVSWMPVWYAFFFDNDFYDHPINDLSPA